MKFKDFGDFLQWEWRSHDTIDVKRCYIDIAQDLVAGILLSQLIYYHLPSKETRRPHKLTVERDGHWWLAKTRDEWWDECRLTPKQVDRAAALLEARGVVETRNYRLDNKKTKHFRVCWNVFLEELEKLPDTLPEKYRTRTRSFLLGDSGETPDSSRSSLLGDSGAVLPNRELDELPNRELDPYIHKSIFLKEGDSLETKTAAEPKGKRQRSPKIVPPPPFDPSEPDDDDLGEPTDEAIAVPDLEPEYLHPTQKTERRFKQQDLLPGQLSKKPNDWDRGYVEWVIANHLKHVDPYKSKPQIDYLDGCMYLNKGKYSEEAREYRIGLWQKYQAFLADKAEKEAMKASTPAPDQTSPFLQAEQEEKSRRRDSEVGRSYRVSTLRAKFVMSNGKESRSVIAQCREEGIALEEILTTDKHWAIAEKLGIRRTGVC